MEKTNLELMEEVMEAFDLTNRGLMGTNEMYSFFPFANPEFVELYWKAQRNYVNTYLILSDLIKREKMRQKSLDRCINM